VHTTTNLLGCVEKLRYSKNDVVDVENFLEFARRVYLDNVGIGPFNNPILQPKQWAARLANTDILNLLDIPHFGRGRDVKNCIKKMMEVTHGGYIWVEDLVSIYVELISYIKGLPSRGENPAQYLDDKTMENVLIEDMKKTYGIEKGSRGIIIKPISDTTMRLATKIMAFKLLKKFCKEEVHAQVVAVATQCVERTMLSWAPYLLNLFHEVCRDAQDLGIEFHYSSILIFIN
jgi:hypothetical protein